MQKTARCLTLLSMVAATACGPDVETRDAGDNASSKKVARTDPAPAAPMDRAALLWAAARAGSAAALPLDDDREQQRSLDGRPFEVRIRFGCASRVATAPAARAGPFNVRFNSSDRTLRVRATPDLARDTPQVAMAGVERVEGFWMRRPWLLAPGCPVSRPAPEGAAFPVSEQRVGIVQFSSAADTRTGDGSPYEVTRILPEGATPSREGYDLVLSGRLRRYPDGRVILCRTMGLEAPPECVISAHFYRVSIQAPDGTVLGEWDKEKGAAGATPQ